MARSRIFAAAAAIGLSLAAPAHAAELVVGVRAGGESMDPHFSAVGSNIAAVRNVFEALVGLDDELQTVPGLAERWEVVDDTTWRFHLRPGVTFHDGSALDAADIVASFARIPLAAGPDGGLTTYVRRIVEIVPVDDLTVDVRTNGAAATLPLDLTRLFVIPSEVAADTPTSAFNAGEAAIGTGPFRLVSFTPRQEMVLEPYPDHWSASSGFERVTFEEISNDSARVAALLSDRVDFIDYVPAADIARIEASGDYTLHETTGIFIFKLFVDHREETPMVTAKDGSPLDENPFRNLKVRQALSLAINREGIAERIMEGRGTPASQFLTPGFFGYVDDLPPLAHDPEEGRRLMAEAGYPDGFRTELYCTSDRLPLDGTVCAALGPMLARIGIEANVNATPRAVYFPAQAAGSYSLMMNGWSSPTGEGTYFLSSALHTRDRDAGWGGFNHWHHSNAELDPIIREAATTLDEDARRALIERAIRMAREDMAMIPIVNLNVTWAGRSGAFTFAPRVDQETLAINFTPAE